MKTYLAMTGLLASALVGAQAHAAEREGPEKDAWIDGTLEAVYSLNRHLSAFPIDTEVDGGIVHLSGNVAHDIDRDLAEELAKNVDGVVRVENDLAISAESRSTDARPTAADTRADVRADTRDAADRRNTADRAIDAEDADRPFGMWISDVTTTAAVKTRLVGNSNTAGLQISVDTYGDEVTLSGEVDSAQEFALAEEIARSTNGVTAVNNQLTVRAAR